jgi:hypothetical protein
MRTPYLRTPHLPWSPWVSADDVRIADLGLLHGREVVVTEKLDGENTTLYADGVHARSLDSAHHPSRSWVKGLQGRIGSRLPRGWRICGEDVYARHSIGYSELESWFYGFSVWDGDRCLDWNRTVRFLREVGVPAPPGAVARGVRRTGHPEAAGRHRASRSRMPGAVLEAVGDRVGAFQRLCREVKAWARARGLDSAPFGGVPGLGWSVLAARTVRDWDGPDLLTSSGHTTPKTRDRAAG